MDKFPNHQIYITTFYGQNFLIVDGEEMDETELLGDGGGGGGEDLPESGSAVENQVSCF